MAIVLPNSAVAVAVEYTFKVPDTKPPKYCFKLCIVLPAHRFTALGAGVAVVGVTTTVTVWLDSQPLVRFTVSV